MINDINRFNCFIINLLTSALFWFLISIILFVGFQFFYYTNLAKESFHWQDQFYRLSDILLSGIIASFIFYFVMIFIPKENAKKIIKNNFFEIYYNIKESIIFELLFCYGKKAIDPYLVKKLSNPPQFREFFKHKDGEYTDRYHILENKLNFGYIKKIILQLKILEKNLEHLIQNYEIKHQNHFSFLKQLQMMMIKLENLNSINEETEEKKVLLQFIWNIFAGWSWIDGYRNTDIIQDMVKDI